MASAEPSRQRSIIGEVEVRDCYWMDRPRVVGLVLRFGDADCQIEAVRYAGLASVAVVGSSGND